MVLFSKRKEKRLTGLRIGIARFSLLGILPTRIVWLFHITHHRFLRRTLPRWLDLIRIERNHRSRRRLVCIIDRFGISLFGGIILRHRYLMRSAVLFWTILVQVMLLLWRVLCAMMLGLIINSWRVSRREEQQLFRWERNRRQHQLRVLRAITCMIGLLDRQMDKLFRWELLAMDRMECLLGCASRIQWLVEMVSGRSFRDSCGMRILKRESQLRQRNLRKKEILRWLLWRSETNYLIFYKRIYRENIFYVVFKWIHSHLLIALLSFFYGVEGLLIVLWLDYLFVKMEECLIEIIRKHYLMEKLNNECEEWLCI